jgi:uncharacterized protein YjdB
MPSLPTSLTGQVGTSINVKSNSVDANGNASNQATIWSTSDASVAIVQKMADNSGGATITCFAAGTATITATAGSASAVFNLTVVNITSGAATSMEVEVDEAFQPSKKP